MSTKKRIKLFDKILTSLKDGMKITFNRSNIAFGDDFLIFSPPCTEQTITFRRHGDLWVLVFDADEPMLLENAPTSFFENIVKNL